MSDIVAVLLNWRDEERSAARARELLCVGRVDAIIVVDNESTGTMRMTLEAYPELRDVILIEVSENRGFAAGVNLGLGCATARAAEYVLLLNTDAQVQEGCIEGLGSRLDRDPLLALVGPKILNNDHSVQSNGVILHPTLAWVEELEDNMRADFVTLACGLVRRAALDQVGDLDEVFFLYWEDVDLSLRFRAAGWRIAVHSNVAILHELNASHAMAGSRPRAYYLSGAWSMARKRGGAWWLGACAATARVLFERVVRGDAWGALLAVRGCWIGIRSRRPAFRVWFSSQG